MHIVETNNPIWRRLIIIDESIVYIERNGLCDAPHKALLLVREKEKKNFLLCYENMRILDHEDS